MSGIYVKSLKARVVFLKKLSTSEYIYVYFPSHVMLLFPLVNVVFLLWMEGPYKKKVDVE